MKYRVKKIASLLMALLMVLNAFPVSFADGVPG